MKTSDKRLLGLILLVFMSIEILHAQSWNWGQHVGSINQDAGGSMCLDGNNNLYVFGNYYFPYGIFGRDTLFTNGIQDMYISKIDPQGNILWSKKAGSEDNPNISHDGSGDLLYEESTNTIIITGTMNGTNELVSSCELGNGDNIFLSKLDLNGNCIWAIGTAFLGHASVLSIS